MSSSTFFFRRCRRGFSMPSRGFAVYLLYRAKQSRAEINRWSGKYYTYSTRKKAFVQYTARPPVSINPIHRSIYIYCRCVDMQLWGLTRERQLNTAAVAHQATHSLNLPCINKPEGNNNNERTNERPTDDKSNNTTTVNADTNKKERKFYY